MDVIRMLHKIHTTKTSQNKTQNTNKTNTKQKYNVIIKQPEEIFKKE